jgi:hypothetical protein
MSPGGDVVLNGEASTGDFLIAASHESLHFGKGLDHDNPEQNRQMWNSDWRAYNQLTPELRQGAVRNSDRFYHAWGAQYGSHPVPGKEHAVRWP